MTFTPPALGKFSATLTATDSASNSPQSILISGVGVLQAAVTPGWLAFGTLKVETPSTAKTAILKNNLTTTLTVGPITASGDYAETDACVGSLAPGATCPISLTFTPTAKGSRPGTLTIADSANNSPQTVSLSGAGK